MRDTITKLSLFLCFFALSLTALPNGGGNGEETAKPTTIQWLPIEDALEKCKENPKKIFVDVYTDWCTWCKKMEASTFMHPTIVEYINENFYPVKLDAEMKQNLLFNNKEYGFLPTEGRNGVHEIALYLTRGRLNYPSVVFLDEGMSNPQPIPGFQNPVRMDKLLKFFGENYYLQVDWGLFNQLYESTISESEMKYSGNGMDRIHDGSK